MRNNKGYTLLEMIVAVCVLLIVLAELGALMVNSQHLYRNGFYELNMQENAQQVIQQIQDMMMNTAGKSIDGTFQGKIERTPSNVGGIPSDIITITTQVRDTKPDGTPLDTFSTVVYEIGREVDFDNSIAFLGSNTGGVDKRYSNLVMKTTVGTNPTSAPIIMAEGVRAIHISTTEVAAPTGAGKTLIMTNYDTADLVTLQVEMQNQQYSYTASGETYLRNQPGTGGPTPYPNGGSSGGDVDLNVLRCHAYNLKDYVPSEYVKFKVDDANTALFTSEYTFDEDGHLKCNSLNNDWNHTKVEATIWAAKVDKDGNPIWTQSQCKEIKIHTVPVVQGVKLPVYGPDRSDPFVSAFPVEGICVCPKCLASRSIEAQFTLGEVKKFDSDSFDLALYKGASNFNITHKVGGSDVAYTQYDEIGKWLNVKYAEGTTTTASGSAECADTTIDPRFKLQYVAYNHVSGKGSEHSTSTELSTNFSEHKNYYCIANENGNWTTELKFRSINAGTSNCLALECNQQVQDGQDYWNRIVDNGGYVRIKMTVTFKACPTKSYVCYGYVFPKEWGNDTQHQYLWNMMKSTDYDAENAAYPSPVPTF